MNFNELVKHRQSCRNYSNIPVEKEKLVAMVQAGILSPSACNSQPWHFVIVNDEEKVAKMPSLLQQGGINKFTDNVRAYIVVCETKAKLFARATCDSQHYAQMDIGLTVSHLVFSAVEQGLATCIVGSFPEDQLKELLSIPNEAKIRLVVAVGYAQEDKIREKSRKEFDDVCSFNQW
ncbi:MAG: nitroreductase family protein [Oscillospiraceae bacterium]